VEEGHEEGSRNYRRLRNGLTNATDLAKKWYLESIYDEIMEFQGHDLRRRN
jgi:hypothetical protein